MDGLFTVKYVCWKSKVDYIGWILPIHLTISSVYRFYGLIKNLRNNMNTNMRVCAVDKQRSYLFNNRLKFVFSDDDEQREKEIGKSS